jgi:osmotically-inducible protein OsmY
VDWPGRLIGIVSQGDVLGGFAREDADIRREVIRDIIARGFLLDPQAFRVTVSDGIVTLSGRPESDEVGRLLAAAVRRAEGVVSLRDQMQYSAGGITGRPLLLPHLPWLSRATAALALAFR